MNETSATVTVWNITRTIAQAHEALTLLAADNAKYGESDDRISEANAIRAALAEVEQLERDRTAAQWAAGQVADASSELARMAFHGERNVPADHRIEFEDNGHRRTSYYSTRDGFLRALVRMYSRPTRFDVIHVD